MTARRVRRDRPGRERCDCTAALPASLGSRSCPDAYKPGDLLDGEIAASEQFAVSRTAYREAVRILAAKGLVDARPKVGTRIKPQSQWNLLDPDVLDWTFESEPDLATAEQPVRAAQRGRIGRGGPGRQAPLGGQPESHARSPRRMATHTLATPRPAARPTWTFTPTLLTATNNPFIISLTNGVNAAIRTTTIFKQRKRPLRRDPLPDHLRVFKAIAAKQALRAERAMSELIGLARMDTPTTRRPPRRSSTPSCR